ncbi:phospholipase D family protein [Chitinilyticum piscinae]|uniref:Phospholipase D family protein n=1 Tax=Chitinilyticum piscinae TaxID=2866724 RepID=A0A8J7FXC5_9NEIS|nr:phospholipase D family protein [Chitinilyticum piscinae]MBE9608375.1 phospholipase D family protein [Chitinilyticum piscinae]
MRQRLARTLRFALLKATGRLPQRPQDVHGVEEGVPGLFARLLAERVGAHPGQSGLTPLEDGEEALLARLVLIHNAESTLDLQYYIWRNDLTGTLLLLFCLQAADRGVKVRLLLDDLGSQPGDALLRALDSHPNIEIRLYNPVAWRRWRWVGLLLGALRLNRRMHNKSLTVDRTATIIGGRNIGDEYFGANAQVDFHDLDVLGAGEVVGDVADAFELYWEHRLSLPVEVFYRRPLPESALAAARVQLQQRLEAQHGSGYLQALGERLADASQRQQVAGLYWGKADVLFDHPDKTLAAAPTLTLTEQLQPLMDDSRHQLDIVSPYFVPGLKGVLWLRKQAQRGVGVRILTNSLAATDVTAVHAGYARYRRLLLSAGVQLYELRPDPSQHIVRRKWLGRSRSSLHAKTFVLDQRYVFIGSLNFDPRSMAINTEIGVIFDSPALAARLGERFERLLKQESYALEVRRTGLRWRDVSGVRNWKHEPHTGPLQRLWVGLLQLLPIESQL